jgi:phosphotransferase system HPr (HPr) family protein
MFVQRASSCPFGVTIEKGGKSADAKSILSIMAQAIRKGDEVVLKTGGDDLQAQEALDALSAILTDETA